MRHLGLLVLLAGCAAYPASSGPVTGEWGGNHIGLHLQSGGGTIEYDCASGTIGPVVIARDGSFTASGTHTPAAGGPEIQGQVRPTYATQFSGNVRGDRMTLQGQVETGVELGPFELRRGAEPGIFRCL